MSLSNLEEGLQALDEERRLLRLQAASVSADQIAEDKRAALAKGIRSSPMRPAQIARLLGWSRQRVNGVLHQQ